ncbi:hypothetical protein MKW94_006364 [Papaver nudicaule]|uniref:Bidirectional sugar transporter SWEET n=1 Tax=Papaver nudicaule TaxID=74823 RepID=A0AA41VP74_PAPNU|nr:hypothetical protein [Papaver nudicaule]
MVSTDAIRTVVGIIGNVISFGLFLSPIPTFYTIYKKNAVEAGISPDPYLTAILNCALWVYYGQVTHNSLLFVTMNGTGLVIELVYVALMLLGEKYIWPSYISLVPVLFITLSLNSKQLRDTAIVFLGTMCVYVNFCTMSPYDMLGKVHQTKSLEHISFWLSLLGVLNGGCWFTYGLLRLDGYILTMSIMNCALGIVQLSVYAYYYFRYPQQSNNKIHDGNLNAAGGELQLPDAGQINN